MASPPFKAAGPVANISGSAVQVSLPAGVSSGDLLVLFVALPFSDATFNPPAGFTDIGASYDQSNVFLVEFRAFWKLAGASEPASYSVSVSGQAGGNNSGTAIMLAWSGAYATAPIQATPVVANGAASTSIACPSVTTLAADATLVCFYGDRSDLSSETFTPATGMTQRAYVRGTAGVPFAVDDVAVATAGATGTKTVTASAAHPWAAISFAIASQAAAVVNTINCTTGSATAAGAQASVQGSVTINGAVGNAGAAAAPATITNGVPTTTIACAVGSAAAAGAQAAVGTFIQTDVMPNNTGLSVLANTAVVWTWTPNGRVGSMAGLTPVDGAGTTDANGRLAPGIAVAAGRLSVAVRNASAKADDVFEQYF